MSTSTKYNSPRSFRDLSSALSYRIYGAVKDTKMIWVPLSYCSDYVVSGGYSLACTGHKAHVWCSGYDKPFGQTNRPEKIWSVRGQLSLERAKNHMNLKPPCAGDPLLLVREVFDVDDADIKPCVFLSKSISTLKLNHKQGVRSITTSDSLDTILTTIKNSSCVVTNLLEGLVLADAFKVPSAYLCNQALPYRVRDYLSNFSTSSFDVVDNIPNFDTHSKIGRARNVEPLKSKLLKTIPDI